MNQKLLGVVGILVTFAVLALGAVVSAIRGAVPLGAYSVAAHTHYSVSGLRLRPLPVGRAPQG